MTTPSRSTIAMTSAIRSFCRRLGTPNEAGPPDLEADIDADTDVDMEADIGEDVESGRWRLVDVDDDGGCSRRLLSSTRSCPICLTCAS